MSLISTVKAGGNIGSSPPPAPLNPLRIIELRDNYDTWIGIILVYTQCIIYLKHMIHYFRSRPTTIKSIFNNCMDFAPNISW